MARKTYEKMMKWEYIDFRELCPKNTTEPVSLMDIHQTAVGGTSVKREGREVRRGEGGKREGGESDGREGGKRDIDNDRGRERGKEEEDLIRNGDIEMMYREHDSTVRERKFTIQDYVQQQILTLIGEWKKNSAKDKEGTCTGTFGGGQRTNLVNGHNELLFRYRLKI